MGRGAVGNDCGVVGKSCHEFFFLRSMGST